MDSLRPDSMRIIRNDEYLKPYSDAILGRYKYQLWKEHMLTSQMGSLSKMASGYTFFGLHRGSDGFWYFREWAPNATRIVLVGTFNDWQELPEFEMTRKDESGVWEIVLPLDKIHHLDLYKLKIYWDGGEGERIPAWADRVVQDENTKIFNAQVWDPAHPYRFRNRIFKPQVDPLMIYECHIGMGTSEEKVGTYEEFRVNVLPRVYKLGYTAIQIMAIQEHPYYGSFGYHVSNFFAASSRFGTPDELKHLIDDAHGMGIAVIMDIVHSHAVKNELEGLGNFCGMPDQYFYAGDRREHPAWDSLCFNYASNDVLHFLLSNCKYWLDVYNFDGFRFDGVTSMLYCNHGLGQDFTGYADYYNGNQDGDAICYLTLANKLIHEFKPNAITIAEEMSGMPGLACPVEDGGMGFDYRLAMGIPDYWIKLLKEKRDEDWNTTDIYWTLTNRRKDEKTISYVESHDQALVGDKTVIFRLIDSDMYWHFKIGDENLNVHRGIALHKMIRLITMSTINGGYLNFMGNEFGHPEWIDFPREGNGWSHKYARRQWDLVDRDDLNFKYLNAWDRDAVHTIESVLRFSDAPIIPIWDNRGDHVIAFERRRLLFVFNFDGERSYTDYGFLCKNGEYSLILNSDDPKYGGFGNVKANAPYHTQRDPMYDIDDKGWLKLYIPARSVLVFKRNMASK
ncbi:MAG: alpha amylase C-terminal domain-containing protein [Bacteroidales bacterium]|nr:alpha amylase C-terminal domain-containing protein [Candidatus Liminaster caballi]